MEDARESFVPGPARLHDIWPFFWISRVSATYAAALEKRLKPLGVDVPRWRVLISLSEGHHMSVSEIAEFSALKLNTTTKIVQRMQADDLIQTRVRPTDGRVTEVSLTAAGEQLRAQALIEMEHLRDEGFCNIAPGELAQLKDILERIGADLSKML